MEKNVARVTYCELLQLALEAAENPERDAKTLFSSLVEARPELHPFSALTQDQSGGQCALRLVRPPLTVAAVA